MKNIFKTLPLNVQRQYYLLAKADSKNVQAYEALFTSNIVFAVNSVVKNYPLIHFTEEDLINETFIVFQKSFGDVQSFDTFSGWLCTVTENVYKTMLRKTDRAIKSESPIPEKHRIEFRSDIVYPDQLDRLLHDEEKTLMYHAINLLNDEDQLYVNHVLLQGMNDVEAAKIFETSHDSIRLRRLAVIERLRMNVRSIVSTSNVPVSVSKSERIEQLFVFMINGQIADMTGISHFSAVKSFLSGFGLSFIWLMSVLFFGLRAMSDLTQKEFNFSVRIWLIKALFFAYCGIVLSPLLLFTGIYFACILPVGYSNDTKTAVAGIVVISLLLVFLCTYFVLFRFLYSWIRKKYKHESTPSDTILAVKAKTASMINRVTIMISLLMISGFIYFVPGLFMWPKYSLVELLRHSLINTLLYIGCFGCIHLFAWLTFRKMTDLSDRITLDQLLGKGESLLYHNLTSLFLVLTLGIPLGNLLFFHTRTIISIIELMIFVPMWLITYINNRRRYRHIQMCIVFLIQVIILVLGFE